MIEIKPNSKGPPSEAVTCLAMKLRKDKLISSKRYVSFITNVFKESAKYIRVSGSFRDSAHQSEGIKDGETI